MFERMVRMANGEQLGLHVSKKVVAIFSANVRFVIFNDALHWLN